MQTAIGSLPEFKVQSKGLVVDDDPVWQRNFSRYLSEVGLSSKIASSLGEAEDLLDREFFHIALVDLSLVEDDNRDGNRVIHKIYQQLDEGTEGILLTAFGTVEEGAEAKTYGAFDVMAKQRLNYAATILTIEKALSKVSAALNEYRVGIGLLSGPSGPDDRYIHESNIIHALGVGYGESNDLSLRLFNGLYPVLWLSHRGQATLDNESRVVTGTYWSKMIGGPFAVLLGRADLIDEEIFKFQQAPQQYDGGKYHQILRVEKRDRIGGIIFEANGPAFEEFDSRHLPMFRKDRT